MAKSRRILVFYWKYQYGSSVVSINKRTRGHGGMLLYEFDKSVGPLPKNPFDYDWLRNMGNELTREFKDGGMDYNNEDKDTFKEVLKDYLEENDLSNAMPRPDVNIVCYISWVPEGIGDGRRTGLGATETLLRQKENTKDLRLDEVSQELNARDFLLHMISYNTYDTNNVVTYNIKAERSKKTKGDANSFTVPWMSIPVLGKEKAKKGTCNDGLDFDKIVRFWIGVNAGNRNTYKITSNNCCKTVVKAMRFAGADKYYKWPWRVIPWDPRDLHDYCYQVSIAIKRVRAYEHLERLAMASRNTVRLHEEKHADVLWSKTMFKKESNVACAHRYQLLKDIDKCLEEYGKNKKPANNIVLIQNINRLLTVKEKISQIFFKRPKTKRWKSLFTLLCQCDCELYKIQTNNVKKDSNVILRTIYKNEFRQHYSSAEKISKLFADEVSLPENMPK